MGQIIQRLIAGVSIILLVVFFYLYKKQQVEQLALTEKLDMQTATSDSLETQLRASTEERGVLKAENELKKLEIGRANDVLASVLNNMDEIAAREADTRSLLRENNPERRGRLISSKEYRKIDHEINSYLEAMYTTLNMSRKSVKDLEIEMSTAMDENEQLKSFVVNLQRMVETQDRTITELREEKEALLKQLAQYEEENQTLRKAWITIGSIEDLRAKKIVRKPFLRPIEVNPLDSTKFAAFDIREKRIPLGNKAFKDVNILSEHKRYPELFELSTDGKSIEIKDAKQFWRVSKFVIIEVQ